MKTPLWTLLLLGLFNPAWSDCKKDCILCSKKLSKESGFNNLVCLIECHGKLAPGNTWEMCRRTIEIKPKAPAPPAAVVLKRAEEEAKAPQPLEEEEAETLQRFNHVTRAVEVGKQEQEIQRMRMLSKKYKVLQAPQEYEEEPAQDSEEEQDEDNETDEEEEDPVNLYKRFGGFLKNKYGYKKFMDPGKSVQKRYGGFIGVRKSARKWNNQKRFSEFLKQYLGMTTRASMAADVTKNE